MPVPWHRRGTPPVLAALLALAAAAPAWAADRGAAPAPGPPHADRDGDGLFDDLESRLDRDERVRVIVTLAAPATRERVARLERAVGDLRVYRRFGVIDAFAATAGPAQVRALARRRGVVHVEEDGRVRARNDTSRSSFGVAEARADAPGIDGDRDDDPGAYSAADLVAAVIDTGVDPDHADLDEGKVIAFRDFVNGRSSAYDDNGHGTHVAGTLAGDGDGTIDRRYQGVAPGAALVVAKVLDRNGDGFESDVVAAIEWAVDNRATFGIEAINLSLGGDPCADGRDAGSRAVDAAHAAGLVVVVAAGNAGPALCTVESPGAARDAITVGAMADTGEAGFFQAFFSSRGRTADGRIKPDLSAPGVDITSARSGTEDEYSTYDGTSFAAPFVAGVALLMRDVNPTLGSDDVKRLLRDTAVDWGRGGDGLVAGSTGPDIEYGAGRLDAYAAIRAAGAPIASPPTVPDHRLLEGTLGGTGELAAFELAVDDTRFPVAATLILPGVSTATSSDLDFDLELVDPTGFVVASTDFTTRQDELGHRPAIPGTYTLRVRSREGAGSFYVDVSAGLEGADPAPGDQTSAQPPPSDPPPPAASGEAAPSRFAGSAAGDCPVAGTASADVLDGGLGDDCLDGAAGADTLAGGSGADRLAGGPGEDTLAGGPGNDRIDGGAERDVATGDDGDDVIDGGPGSNIVDGGIGDDEITGGERADSLNGGPDEDTIRGGDGDDGITGASGRDRLFGEDGDDRIEGGLGKDVIDAGPGGDNIVAIDGQTDTVRCGRGRDVVRADGGDRIARDCERVIRRDEEPAGRAAASPAAAAAARAGAAAGGNAITGDGSGGELRGTPAADTIDSPLAGNLLLGLAGDDVLAGGSGDDEARGAAGEDVVSGGPGADLLLGGDARDVISGGPGDDRLAGDRGSNIMNGGPGDDILAGGERADSLNGGSDEDTIRGGDGNDGITGASGRDRLFGEDGDDRIEGGLGKDVIDAGPGGDNIVAADGQVDTIRCGPGRDVVRADREDRVSRDCERVIARRGSAYVVIRR